MKRRSFILVLAFLLTAMSHSAAIAQESFPSRPVTNVAPFAPGTGTDLLCRTLGKVLPKYLGQPVITMNRAGAGGTVGVQSVVTSDPDGYTLVSTGMTITMPELYIKFRKTDFTSKDLTPISSWTSSIGVIAVRKDAPWNTFKEFMQAAKTKNLKFAGPGKTTGNYVYGLALGKKYNVKLTGVPLDGAAQEITNLLGGNIDMAILLVSAAHPQVSAGKMKVLAVMHPARVPSFADIPTTYEEGYDVGFTSFDIGTYAPAKTPAQRIKILDEAIRKTTQDREFKAGMDAIGEIVNYADTATFTKNRNVVLSAMTAVFKDLGYLDR